VKIVVVKKWFEFVLFMYFTDKKHR